MSKGKKRSSAPGRKGLSISSLSLPRFAGGSGESRKRCYLLLVIVTAVYLLTFRAVPISTLDDQLMLTSAMFFVETGKFTAPSRFADKNFGLGQFAQQSAAGEVYSKYTSGYPMVLAIFIVVANWGAMLFGMRMADWILCLPSILALLAATLLIWRTAIRLDMPSATANLAAIGIALGSFAWPYGGINFSEPLQMLCILAAFYCLLAAQQHEEHWWQYSALGGIALAYAIWVKPALGVMAPVYVLGALFEWRRRLPILQALRRSILYAAPGLAISAYVLASNFLLFGDAREFGYSGETFSTPLSEGLIELTFGWARGVIWFAPLVLLAPWGFYRLIKLGKLSPALIMGFAATAYVILLSQWHGYGGGNCWGPRLLLPALPLMILLAAGALESKMMRWIGGGLIVAGMAVNSLGALINYNAHYATLWIAKSGFDPEDPAFNQIRCHFWLLRVHTQALARGVAESEVPLWKEPPWIGRYPDAVPPPYPHRHIPIAGAWPLRLAMPEQQRPRYNSWYLRALLEVAISKYEQGDMAGALSLIDEGLDLYPDHKELVAAKGLVYYSVKDMPRALTHFTRSLKLDPDYELGLYGVGLVMEATGKAREAYLAYTRLLKLPLRNLDRQEILNRIKNLDSPP
jgi:4-amino-4-deoxy-L-arabinose transferase-like glycosyltransferase